MHLNSRDNIPTLVGIGIIAYVAADLAHHALGHGAACLIAGGRINLLSSIFVDCSRTGAAIDLAGPCANLALGLLAAWGVHLADRLSTAPRLFFILLAAFNLMWFAMQLVFSALTMTDDWAWPMHVWQVAEPVRYAAIAMGALAYVFIVRFIGAALAPFARPINRTRIIVGTAWLGAGAIACATAASYPHPAAALRVAAPQSLLLSLGILFTPRHAARAALAENSLPAPLALSIAWIASAIVVAVLSVAFLGPGISLAR
jgi:hypothetical protein